MPFSPIEVKCKLFGIFKAGEEGAELAQATLKLAARSDEYREKDGNEIFEKLVEEFGDNLAASDIAMHYATPHFFKRVMQRRKEKIRKHAEWLEKND